MKKNKKRFPALALGTLLIVAAAALLFYNYYVEKSAGRKAREISAEIEELLPEDSGGAVSEEEGAVDFEKLPELEIDGNSDVGILFIPAMNLELPVLSGPEKGNGAAMPYLRRGEEGFMIYGHNYSNQFAFLSSAASGDEVIFEDARGNRVTYSAASFETLSKTAIDQIPAKDYGLTLLTNKNGSGALQVLYCN